MRQHVITSPIFYANSSPHLGHLYTSLLVDAQARFKRLICPQDNILSTSGSDEHGFKIQKAAMDANLSPISYVQTFSTQFQNLFSLCQTKPSTFIRTSSPQHVSAVRHFWERLLQNGVLSKQIHEGWYSVQDETFLSERQITERGNLRVSLESGHPVEWIKEENYVFPLSNYFPQIQNWLTSNKIIHPLIMSNSLKDIFKEESSSLSVSRPSYRLHWGIPVPNDESQIIYVWLDALVSYLTIHDYPLSSSNHQNLLSNTTHVLGKDILKFHAVYWPAFLLAAGMELPRKLIVHSHWLMNGEKMSKSYGNVLCPTELMASSFGNLSDSLRFALLHEGVLESNGNFDVDKMKTVVRTHLGNVWGNLLNRVTGTAINPKQIYPPFTTPHSSLLAAELMARLSSLSNEVQTDFENFYYYRGLRSIFEVLRLTNVFVDEEKIWILSKKEEEKDKLTRILNIVFESLRITSLLLQPIVPNSSAVVLKQLGIKETLWSSAIPSWISKDSPINTERPLESSKVILLPKF